MRGVNFNKLDTLLEETDALLNNRKQEEKIKTLNNLLRKEFPSPFCFHCGNRLIYDSQDEGELEGVDIQCECGETVTL